MLWEVFIYIVFSGLQINFSVANIATAFMLLFSELLFEYFTKSKGNLISDTVHLVAIIFIPIGSIVIGIFTMTEFNIFTAIIALILLAINATVFYLYDVLGRFYEKEREKLLLEQQNKAYINQMSIENESQKVLQFFRHDMDNHFIKMKDFLIEKNYSGLADYLGECSEYTAPAHQYSKSGNIDVDAILNYKLRKIGEKGIDIVTKINLPNELAISVFDLNIILGNLVDNAVDELFKHGEGRLYVEAICKKGVIFIKVENSCFSDIVFENERFLTSKLDFSNHGLGLQSVQYTLDKYNGEMSINTDNDTFTVNAVLYNNSPR
jgi:sensor histidine kinase YesM